MKKTTIFILAAIASLSALAGCGKLVEVPPAYEGKILTPNGYKPDTIPPSVFRMKTCWWPGAICDKLILIEKSDKGLKESFNVFMPKDGLNLAFDLRMTTSIKENSTDSILNRLKPVVSDRGEKYIPFDTVYTVYAQPRIRDVVRNTISQYSIEEVQSSRAAINAQIEKDVAKALTGTPIELLSVGLAAVDYPKEIIDQLSIAKQREIQIAQQEAIRQKKLIELKTELDAAKAQRAIRRENAEAAAEENKIAAASVTQEYLAYKRLEVLMALAQNGNSVYVPFGALDEVGLSNSVFGVGKTSAKLSNPSK